MHKVILSLTLFLTLSLWASPNVGQEILEKKLKSGCTISIADLATKHSQKEWEELKDQEKLKEELLKLEPNLKEIGAKELPDIFDFLYEYAKDSGLFPSCGS